MKDLSLFRKYRAKYSGFKGMWSATDSQVDRKKWRQMWQFRGK